jgi:hypothetical protein
MDPAMSIVSGPCLLITWFFPTAAGESSTSSVAKKSPKGTSRSLMDRGRIYITYGPPDQIESHPSGEPKHPQPFEDWRYPTLQFRFVSEDGRYKLVSTSVQEKPTPKSGRDVNVAIPLPGRLVRQIPRQTLGDRVVIFFQTRNHILTGQGHDANALHTVGTLDGDLLATNLDLTSLKKKFPDLDAVATG